MLHFFNRVSSKISGIMIAFDAGARAEGTKFSPGLAHMLEHMVFKGTDKRDHLDISREIGFLGGNINAFTSAEMVAFYVTVPYENAEKAIEILSDIVFNSTFPEDEFIKEREVVKEEELSSKDSVNSFIFRSFVKEFFKGRSSEPIIGTQESISEFTTKEIKAFYKKFYKKSGAIVSFCSNHSKRDGKKLLNKYFGRSSGKVSHKVDLEVPEYQDAREVTITRTQLEHAYVWMGYPGSKIGDEGETAEKMMLSIFGGGADSRLFSEVREKLGICYSIGASALPGRDYSATVITSSTRIENVEEMTAAIEVEIERIKTTLVTDEELERARNKFRAQSYSILESSMSMAEVTLSRAFYDQVTMEELFLETKSVTAEDIQEAAIRLFDNSKRLLLVCKEEEKNEG